ncbi:MAG: hypothetical protein RIS47_1839 [Bacteroidota bacterium]
MCAFFSLPILAQDTQLALKYFQDQEYDKAVVLLQKIFEAKPNRNVFRYYVRSLSALKQFDKAEDVTKAEMKRSPDDPNYPIELGSLYKAQDKPDKAKKIFDGIIDNLREDQAYIQTCAAGFSERSEFEYALRVYDKGIRLGGSSEFFRMEKARIYSLTRNYQAMVAEYLDLIETTPTYMSVVQSNLQYYLSFDVDNNLVDIIRTQCFARLRIKPDQIVFAQMLSWIFIQEKKFDQALVQVKAIDLRMGSSGQVLSEFALVALNNNEYSVARKAYQAIIDFKDKPTPAMRVSAQAGILKAAFLELTNAELPSGELATILESGLQELIVNQPNLTNADPIAQLAEIQAFYLSKSDSAITLLTRTLQTRRFPQDQMAQLEMLLGDIYLAAENPWDAILTYGRVEKANHLNDVGSEAKFRKTKVAYFTGDFEWAKTQLDILKASTSKLIANDALALYLLIDDNTSGDSVETPLKRFANAQMLLIQRRKLAAYDSLSAIIRDFPNETIAENSLLERAKLSEFLTKNEQALADYKLIFTKFEFSVLADDAMIRSAQIYERTNQPELAKNMYQEFLTKYKGSVFTNIARTQFRLLRGDKLQ